MPFLEFIYYLAKLYSLDLKQIQDYFLKPTLPPPSFFSDPILEDRND